MAIAPAAWTPSSRPGLTVDVVTPDRVAEYYDTFVAGWGAAAAAPDPAAMHADLAGAIASGRFHMFIARDGGVAAGTAGFILKPRSAYLVGGNVLAAHRGRGVYRALLDARLTRLAALGVPLATTQARVQTSAPI